MKSIHRAIILSTAFALAACANSNGPSAANRTRAQFLDEVWVAPAYRGKPASHHFTKVYFAPVAIGNLSRQGWWESQSAVTQRQLNADARKLAAHFHRALVVAAHNDPGRKLVVVNGPGPDTLTVQAAITELVPAKAYWNAAATTAGFVVPGAGLLGMAGSGTIRVEGRLLDGNNSIAATFRDRMKDKMAVVNIDSYSWYGGSEANLNEMAANIARVLNAEPGTVVNQPSQIKLAAY